MSTEDERKERHRRNRQQIDRNRLLLCVMFPQTFMPKGAAKKPLKIGIHRDILAICPDFPKGQLKRALHDYTSGRKYLRACEPGAFRIDLEGKAVDCVTQDAAEVAVLKLARAEAMVAAHHATKG